MAIHGGKEWGGAHPERLNHRTWRDPKDTLSSVSPAEKKRFVVASSL